MGAAAIDLLIIAVGFLLLSAVGGSIGLSDGETWVVQVGAFIVYGVAFGAILGGTPGKLLLGMQIVQMDGRDIGPFRALLRYFGLLLSVYLLFLGVLMIAVDKQKRGLHDYMANTLVIKARPTS